MIIYKDSISDLTMDQLQGFFVGWQKAPSPETHYKLLQQSSFRIIAIDTQKSDKVIGFITAISDGILSAYIPFLEVLPEYQGNGIGTELMNRMLVLLEHFYMIDIVCDDALLKFYEKFGMSKSNAMIFRHHKNCL